MQSTNVLAKAVKKTANADKNDNNLKQLENGFAGVRMMEIH